MNKSLLNDSTQFLFLLEKIVKKICLKLKKVNKNKNGLLRIFGLTQIGIPLFGHFDQFPINLAINWPNFCCNLPSRISQHFLHSFRRSGNYGENSNSTKKYNNLLFYFRL